MLPSSPPDAPAPSTTAVTAGSPSHAGSSHGQGSAPHYAPEQDVEQFGTVTATLAPDTIRIGSKIEDGAAFQFGVESEPLFALISFEVADLEQALACLAARGVAAESPPKTSVEGYRRATIRDLNGYRLCLFEWTAELSAELFKSEEAAAGIQAFRDKRQSMARQTGILTVPLLVLVAAPVCSTARSKDAVDGQHNLGRGETPRRREQRGCWTA